MKNRSIAFEENFMTNAAEQIKYFENRSIK